MTGPLIPVAEATRLPLQEYLMPPHVPPADRAPPWEKRTAEAAPKVTRFLEGPQPRGFELMRAARVFYELMRGFRTLHFVGPCVTAFGSARFKDGHPYYA